MLSLFFIILQAYVRVGCLRVLEGWISEIKITSPCQTCRHHNKAIKSNGLQNDNVPHTCTIFQINQLFYLDTFPLPMGSLERKACRNPLILVTSFS